MTERNYSKSMQRYSFAGLCGIIAVVGGIGAWSYFSELNGAVIAPGQLVVEGDIKLVQHREGGTIKEILVRNGDRVESGQPLVRLDTLELGTELALVTQQRLEWLAKISRLKAERDGDPKITFAEELSDTSQSTIAELRSTQERIFDAQRAAVESRIGQLRERVEQLEEEITGLKAQRASNQKQFDIARDELADNEKLLARGLIQKPRVLQVRREVARLEGVDGQLIAQIASAEGRISEIRLQIIQLGDDVLRRALEELREADSKYLELTDRRNALSEKLSRATIASPWSGIVHEMTVFNAGAVISPGQAVMQIVPKGEELIVQADVRPQDIDQVYPGQRVSLVFENANARITPQLDGEIKGISAYLRRGDDTTPPAYSVRVAPVAGEIEKMGDLELRPGMQVTAFIQTDARTPLSFLTKPLWELWIRMFRER